MSVKTTFRFAIPVAFLGVISAGCASTSSMKLGLRSTSPDGAASDPLRPMLIINVPIGAPFAGSSEPNFLWNNLDAVGSRTSTFELLVIGGGLYLLSKGVHKKSAEPKRCYSKNGVTEVLC